MPDKTGHSAKTVFHLTFIILHFQIWGVGWFYFGARFYDPGIGRFLSVDPLAEKNNAWSPYSYSKDNPLNRIDPDGRNDLFAQLMAFLGVEGHRKSNEYSNFANSRIVIPKAGIDQSGAETFVDALQFLNDSTEKGRVNTAEGLGKASDVTGNIAAACYGSALLTAWAPSASTAFAISGNISSSISLVTGGLKAIITGNSKDIKTFGISGTTTIIGLRSTENIFKYTGKLNNVSSNLIKNSVQSPLQIIELGINKKIKYDNKEKLDE